MSQPLDDDPSRPLAAAARWMRGIGVLLLILGAVAAFSAMRSFDQLRAMGGSVIAIVIGVVMAIYFGSGIILLTTAGSVRRGRMWAIILNLGLSGLWLLLILTAVVGGTMTIFQRGMGVEQAIVWGLYVVGSVVVTRVIWLLINGIKKLRQAGAKSFGFAPIVPQQPLSVEPIPPTETGE